MKITLDVSDKNESTDSPWWILVDPMPIKDQLEAVIEHGEMPNFDYIISMIAMSCVEGPFFSREDGENYLKSRRYAYSSEAIIWCSSGYHSHEYKMACRKAREEEKPNA